MTTQNSTSTDIILLAHGSGGELSHELVEKLFVRHFSNPILARLEDAAVLDAGIDMRDAGPQTQAEDLLALASRFLPPVSCFEQPASCIVPPAPCTLPPASGIVPPASSPRLAFTTDSYVVSPIFFPGGDIGKLAVCGTVNDLAMSGAMPLYLSAGFILEEGLPLAELERVVASMAATARAASVQIVTGDTKVVDRGSADKLFINTAGVGVVPAGVELGSDRVLPGDAILLSGTLGDHGMTIMSQREGLGFASPLLSDCAPLQGLVAAMLQAAPQGLRCLRDPTRGGLATTLNEVAGKSGVGIEIEEAAVPVLDGVRAACELLGLDPLYVANEGKLVAFVAPEAVDVVLQAMRTHEYGQAAAVIGQANAEHPRRVVLRTPLGARRILDMLVGEQLPRIC